MFLGRLSIKSSYALISTLCFLDGAVRHSSHAFLENLVAKFTEDLEKDDPCELPRKRRTSDIFYHLYLPLDSF